MTVLIVDDECDGADALALLLGLQGFHAVVARSGAEALSFIERERPHAAVIDLAMPDITGFDLAKRIRAEWGMEMRLIALTGLVRRIDREQAVEAGFDRFLLKPAPIEQLLQALDACRLSLVGAH